MSSPEQRRGSCGHAVAGFDSHSKCARCRDKGLGDDPCIQKKECDICRGFTPDQILQLATPTYRDRKEKKTTTASFTPTLVDRKVVEKLQDYPCNRIILIAPGWPNMPWFWDLVAMSSQIPLCLPNIPNLVSQPFNQVLHRNLSNLNLHALGQMGLLSFVLLSSLKSLAAEILLLTPVQLELTRW